jgi:prolyl-tRNA synthetase
MLAAVHKELLDRAAKNLAEKTSEARTHEEFLDIAANRPGFIKAMWCGDVACEETLKDETGGVKSRCIPFVEEHLADTCACCGKPAKHMVVWGRQY